MELPTLAASKWRENVVTQIVQHYSYLRSYKENVENLRICLKNIDDRRRILEQEIQEEKRKGHLITQDVKNWLLKAEIVSKQIEKFLNDIEFANAKCLNGLCPNIKRRYQLSYEAKERYEDALRLTGKETFSHISYRAPFPHLIESPTSKQSFKSRLSLVEEILRTLGEKEKIVGICGMPGIGKTIMTEIVAKRAQECKLFDEIAWANVSQKPDFLNSQGEIAEIFGPSIDENQRKVSWDKLRDKMTDKRVLVVLDELWEAIKLDQVEIGDECKVLITTQSRDVCCAMGAKTFTLELLSDGEAWNLFKENVSNPISVDLVPSAKEIIRECEGLPIAIIEVATRFDFGERDQWMDTEAIGAAVSYCIMRSVNYFLKDDDDLKFFFICCFLFPKDSDIPIEYLFRYQMGLMLFDTLEQARNAAHKKVQTLIRQSLLLPSNKLECTRIHNIVRKVAIQMASKFKDPFKLRLSSELLQRPEEQSLGFCYALSLVGEENQFPACLRCSGLELLHLTSHKLQERDYVDQIITLDAVDATGSGFSNFFQRAAQIKVISAKNFQFYGLLYSLEWLNELCTLSLDGCKVLSTHPLWKMQNIQILSFANSNVPILQINPRNLTRLRLLDLTNCKLVTIPCGLLSGFSELEEFYARGSYDKWLYEEQGKVKISTKYGPDKIGNLGFLWQGDVDLELGNDQLWRSSIASLSELNKNNKLRVIDIHIPKSMQLPRGSYFHSLGRFRISIGSEIHIPDEQQHVYLFKSHLRLNLGANEVPVVIKDNE